MKSIMEMKGWNYQQAMNYFSSNAKEKVIPDGKLYLKSATEGPVFDCREEKCSLRIWDEWMTTPTLFVIDGASASGKSTMAKKMAKRYGIKVVDCDVLCIEWIERKVAQMNPMERMLFGIDYERQTDEYLKNNMESEVLKASDYGKKSVILVGAFIEPLARAIVGETIGSHFTNVIGIIMHESNVQDVLENEKKRNREMDFGDNPELSMQTVQEYKYIEELLTGGMGWILGIGTTMTYVVKKSMFID